MQLCCIAGREAKLLSILRRELRLSDGLVRRLKPLNAFTVNGRTAHTDCPIHPGDRVCAVIEEPAPDFPAQDGALDILYEDEALMVLDKPAGVIIHPTFHRQQDTLANYLLGYYEKTGQKCAVHVLTRLDRDTMGVVVFAKNAYIHALLMEQLQKGQVHKTYYAAVLRGPTQDEGSIDLPIARSAPGSLLRCVRADGKPAVTRYRVLERRGDYALLQLQPLTGRTHQLRVHCSHMGFPIAGDPQYGGGAGGQRLLCGRLELSHPLTGAPLVFCSRQKITLPNG
ncbi:MAG: RluA family pseudouridine synthase [Faecousia sp.]